MYYNFIYNTIWQVYMQQINIISTKFIYYIYVYIVKNKILIKI